jgi:hypothetical protein
MEEWYKLLRHMKDDSEDPHTTQKFFYKVFIDLKSKKIKDKGKFRQRMGPEFDGWVSSLIEEFSDELVFEIINDDDFWEKTLKVTIGA